MIDQEHLSELLSDLDSDKRTTRRKSEQALVEIGEDAINGILKSAHEINQRLLSGYQPDSVLLTLQRRIRILGMIKSALGIQMVSAAIADSVELIYTQKARIQQMKSAFIPDATSIMIAGDRLSIAKRLHRVAINALVQIGDEAERQLTMHMDRFSPVVQRSIRTALRKILFRRLCRKVLRMR